VRERASYKLSDSPKERTLRTRKKRKGKVVRKNIPKVYATTNGDGFHKKLEKPTEKRAYTSQGHNKKRKEKKSQKERREKKKKYIFWIKNKTTPRPRSTHFVTNKQNRN